MLQITASSITTHRVSSPSTPLLLQPAPPVQQQISVAKYLYRVTPRTFLPAFRILVGVPHCTSLAVHRTRVIIYGHTLPCLLFRDHSSPSRRHPRRHGLEPQILRDRRTQRPPNFSRGTTIPRLTPHQSIRLHQLLIPPLRLDIWNFLLSPLSPHYNDRRIWCLRQRHEEAAPGRKGSVYPGAEIRH